MPGSGRPGHTAGSARRLLPPPASELASEQARERAKERVTRAPFAGAAGGEEKEGETEHN